MSLARLAAAAVLALAGPAAPLSPEAARGVYRVEARVQLERVPLTGPLAVRGDVRLQPVAGAPGVTLRLSARGQACTLAGRLSPAGSLALDAGQRCTLAFDEPGLRGRVEAVLQGGRGTVAADGRLTLALDLSLSGAVRVSSGGLPGFPLEAEVPVEGPARVTAEGSRDNSRAGDE